MTNSRHQEGEGAAEDPNALIDEAERVAAQLAGLVRRIDATNAASTLEGHGTITDAIAERDSLTLRRKLFSDAAVAATDRSFRVTRSELHTVTELDVAALRARADQLARQRRELDLRIQAADWTTELVEG